MNSVDLENEVGDSIYIMKKQGQNINHELAIGIRRKQRLCSPDLNANYGEAQKVEIRERVEAISTCTGTRLKARGTQLNTRPVFINGSYRLTILDNKRRALVAGGIQPPSLFNLTVDLNKKPGIIISVDKANYNIKDICYVA